MRLDFSWLCPVVGHVRDAPNLGTAARDWALQGTSGVFRVGHGKDTLRLEVGAWRETLG